MAGPAQEQTTAFVTGPIAFLAVAAFAVVLGSLIIGARETDRIALARQRATIEQALDQHGNALARELKVQTVWNEAYAKTRARDQNWMRNFYGTYLSELFGYDRIYVLSSGNQPIFGFVVGRDAQPAAFARIAPGLQDLISALRNPASTPSKYRVAITPVPLGDGEVAEHRAIADVRDILGTPATVVVSTIVPDRSPHEPLASPPMLLVAIEYFDARMIKQLGATFGFENLAWIDGPAPAGTSIERIRALDGADVGTLAWRKNQPGWDFARKMALGLGVALLLLGALTAILMRWGRKRARQLLRSEEEARHAAQTDALTGLPNRVALSETLPKLIDKARWRATSLAVLCIDLDQFKEINDDFGHSVGDTVLLAVSKRLQSLLGPDIMLARRGGDDFMILALGVGPDGISGLAARIVAALAEPITVDNDVMVFVPASVGYALAPHDGERADDLERRVELALAKAKASGGGAAVAFSPEMDLELTRRRTLETALRRALASDAISVAYQPIMDPTGTHVVAIEALARWTDPILGPISPEVFVPLAEETGLIHKVGEIVLRRAVADGRAWPDIDVAVNVSATQVHHGNVVALVRDVLSASRFPAERLEIEITETVLLVDEKRANDQIKGLQRLGVKVALDDFGSGYSSLMYLRKFGFDNLKIDRSFIEGIGGTSRDGSVILESVIRLGLDLSMTITAEGVETVEQHRWLKTSGCHRLQGFLFSRPLTKEQLAAFLAAHRRAAAAG